MNRQTQTTVIITVLLVCRVDAESYEDDGIIPMGGAALLEFVRVTLLWTNQCTIKAIRKNYK